MTKFRLSGLAGVVVCALVFSGCSSCMRCLSSNKSATMRKSPSTPELTDAMEILRRADSATKAVQSVRYDSRLFGTGAAEARIPAVSGTASFVGWSGGGAEKFLCHAEGKQAGSEEPLKVTVGGDGENFYVVDHVSRNAYEDIDPAVIGRTGRPAQRLMMLEFVHNAPFSDELNGDTQELRGSKVIGGEDCYEVRVVYAGGRGEAVWHFSKRDFLPRGRLDVFRDAEGNESGQQRFVTNLEVNPSLTDDQFMLKLPKGYSKTDDFAP